MKALGLVVWEKKIFLCFTHDPPGRGPYGPQGHGLYKGPLYIATHKIWKLWVLWFRRRRFFLFFFTWRPQGGAHMDPRGTVGRIYKEDRYTLLLTKYESSGPCGFREDFFLCFSHCKSMGANDPPGGAVYVPRGMIGRIYIEDH